MSTEKDDKQFSDAGIFNAWKVKWNTDAWQYFGKCPANIPEEEIFLHLFEKAYQESVSKMLYNKKKNMRAKKLFAGCVAGCAMLQLAVVFIAVSIFLTGGIPGMKSSRFTLVNLAAVDALLLLACGLFLAALNAWSRIKKYQETWARHAYTTFQYKQVMLLYLQGFQKDRRISPENSKGTPLCRPPLEVLRHSFKESIFEIMDYNYRKFTQNMETEEADLMKDISAFLK